MKELEEKILREGTVKPGGILKVDNFINHQIDAVFMMKMGKEIEELFRGTGVNKILTIEASGIAIAMAAAVQMEVPFVFAKKHRTSNLGQDVYKSVVASFTHNTDYDVVVSKDYLDENDVVLIIDDFLAHGNALEGLWDICRQAGASVAGAAVVIEKGFQGGGDKLREEGLRIESLAIIEQMGDDSIVFR